jgi:hypothetical protein
MYKNFILSVKRIICVLFCVVLAAGEGYGILILAYRKITFLIGHCLLKYIFAIHELNPQVLMKIDGSSLTGIKTYQLFNAGMYRALLD